MVAVPTLLLKEKQVQQLALDLEIRYLANRDPNLYFALVTDSPDSRGQDERRYACRPLRSLIEDLNRRYRGRETERRSYLFHRHRIYNPSEGRWMGWERKRGKLLDLNHLMRGGFDSFPVKVGDLQRAAPDPLCHHARFRHAASARRRAAAGRRDRASAEPRRHRSRRPRWSSRATAFCSRASASASSPRPAAALASIYSGQTGFDIYTRAVSDVYQDLFGEGIFTGKGIYDVDALGEALDHRFPENALLSHDLIEGAYARAALVSDIELIDDYPSHFSAYSRRKHRWVRGDWQIMRWLLPRVPDFTQAVIANPISLISRWKILDNLRRSLTRTGYARAPAGRLVVPAGRSCLLDVWRAWACC